MMGKAQALQKDVIIVGGGPGGYVAAIRAAQLGLKTLVVEAADLGGVCLNWGCIPTKALLKSAEAYHLATHLGDFGVTVGPVSFDLSQMVARSRRISGTLGQGVSALLKKNKVEVIQGFGALGPRTPEGHTLLITGSDGPQTASAPHVILATGTRPMVLKGLESHPAQGSAQVIWTAREAMVPEKLPQDLLVVGSGAIGLEFASFYSMLGVRVRLIEMQADILASADPDISAALHQSFQKRGIEIQTSTTVEAWKLGSQGRADVVLKTPKGPEQIQVDHILVAAGVIGNTENLGLENTRVRVEKGRIQTHPGGATDEPGIYAIGDVTMGPGLAHKASHEGIICVERIAGHQTHGVDFHQVPSCIYSTPQVAWIGLTEPQVKATGLPFVVGKFPFMANGKALTLGESEGFTKVIFDKETGALLGAHLIGAEVTELISSFAMAQVLEGTEEDFMKTIFPHPTLSEAIHESVLKALDRGIHF
jgi:dihydrolipoamide dehydrogenase